MRRRLVLTIVLLLVSAGPLGCSCPPKECTTPTVEETSVVYHDLTQLESRFPLRRTLQAMVASSGAPVPGSPESLLQSMLDSFAEASFENGAGKAIPVVPRPGEAGLSVSALLDPSSPDAMVPTGLFNRFDLAPEGGATCGEYRITYAKRLTGTPGRFLLIFEAVLRNPTPGEGIAACKPVTDFWTELSQVQGSAERADRLEEFYYQGLPNFDPVVAYENYGVALGQVRSNLFIGFQTWRLREHRASPDVSAGPRFVADTVKQNPIPDVFRTTPLPPDFSPADKQAFRAHFLASPVCNLVRPDRVDPAASQFDVVNGIGGGFDDAFDDFESVSQGLEDAPAFQTDPALAAAIDARLAELGSSSVGSAQLLGRAGAMTCGGCHEFSNGRDLGNGHQWPPSAGFVHITEDGVLSAALTDFLLPRRMEILRAFACDQTPEPPPTAPCPVPEALAEAPRAAPRDLTELLRAVDRAQLEYRRVLREPGVEALRPELRTLEAAVLEAREAERRLPGAFVEVRRVH